MVERDVLVSGSFNTRDLGGYRSQDGSLAWRKTFRSGNMGQVDQAGIDTMKQLGITRVIDLRSQSERDAEPDPFSIDDGIELIAISLFDDLDPTKLPKENALLDLYLHALKTQGSAFVKVLRMISDCPDGVLFHCTAGKDRTGLISALLLALSGVSKEDIIQDYALTAGRIEPLFAKLEQAAKTYNLHKEDFMPMLEAKPETMAETLEWLDSNFQGAEAYVKAHGFTDDDITRLRSRWCLIDEEVLA